MFFFLIFFSYFLQTIVSVCLRGCEGRTNKTRAVKGIEKYENIITITSLLSIIKYYKSAHNNVTDAENQQRILLYGSEKILKSKWIKALAL